MTTSTFATSATEYVDRVSPRIVMIDGSQLAELMIDRDVGVATATTYRLKRIDQDYSSSLTNAPTPAVTP